MIHIVVIEHPGTGEDPEVAYGSTIEAAQRKAVGLLQVWHEITGELIPNDPPPGFLTTHPWPDRRNAVAVSDWLLALRRITDNPRISYHVIDTTKPQPHPDRMKSGQGDPDTGGGARERGHAPHP